MTNVAGIFDSQAQAERAVSQLEAQGIEHDNISLIVSEHARHAIFTKTENEGEKAAKAGVGGAIAGAGLGALLVTLAAVAGFATAGVGLFAAGPIVAMLVGGAGGATVIGFGSALVSAGFSADDANRYEAAVKAGKAVIVVHPENDAEEATARAVLQSTDFTTRAA